MPRRVISGGSVLILLGGLLVAGVLAWQAVTAGGAPDPTAKHLHPAAAVVDTGILVFREGLESLLVLSAVAASLSRTHARWGRPVAAGAGAAFLATLATWFVVVAMLSDVNAPELDLQATTGLLAVAVLLVIMNWFFHRVYWTGWIAHHTRTGRALVADPGRPSAGVIRGLVLLGFASVYREGFEVVLFLQSLRLQVGMQVVLLGSLIGLGITLLVAALNFFSHYRLPYRKMLVLTGILLGGMLVVMVGETVQEMQQAHWLATTKLLPFDLPDWMNVWFSVYNSVESLTAQALTILFVIGSYVVAEYVQLRRPRRPPDGRGGGHAFVTLGARRSSLTVRVDPLNDRVFELLLVDAIEVSRVLDFDHGPVFSQRAQRRHVQLLHGVSVAHDDQRGDANRLHLSFGQRELAHAPGAWALHMRPHLLQHAAFRHPPHAPKGRGQRAVGVRGDELQRDQAAH